MSFTKDYQVTGDDWTVVANGPGAMVQLKTPGPVIIHVAQNKPAASVDDGAILERGELEEFVISAMEEGDLVAVKSKDAETHWVAVIGSGTAPV